MVKYVILALPDDVTSTLNTGRSSFSPSHTASGSKFLLIRMNTLVLCDSGPVLASFLRKMGA